MKLEKQLPYKHKIYKILKSEILNGRYSPGEVLNERSLSEELGISRTPIREALQMLAQDGWVSIETYKGAVVRELDLRNMKEISRIRGVLEVCAIEDAVPTLTDENIFHLEEIYQNQSHTLENFNVSTFIAFDRQFHTYIYECSKNTELLHLLANYYDIYTFLRSYAILNTEKRRIETLNEHRAILDAMKTRDVASCVEAMRSHMQFTEKNMVERLSHAVAVNHT